MPIWEKISSAEMPATISGVTSGIDHQDVGGGAPPRPGADQPDRKRGAEDRRTTIVTTAIRSETNSDSLEVGSLRKSRYHSSEKPWKDCRDLTELNENRMTTAIGMNRKR